MGLTGPVGRERRCREERAREDRAKKTGQAGGGVDQNTAGTVEKTGLSGDCVGKVCSFVSVNTHFVR